MHYHGLLKFDLTFTGDLNSTFKMPFCDDGLKYVLVMIPSAGRLYLYNDGEKIIPRRSTGSGWIRRIGVVCAGCVVCVHVFGYICSHIVWGNCKAYLHSIFPTDPSVRTSEVPWCSLNQYLPFLPWL